VTTLRNIFEEEVKKTQNPGTVTFAWRNEALRCRVLRIKFAAAISVEFFFFCGPTGSLTLAPGCAGPARA
jgi:hypothetical protein